MSSYPDYLGPVSAYARTLAVLGRFEAAEVQEAGQCTCAASMQLKSTPGKGAEGAASKLVAALGVLGASLLLGWEDIHAKHPNHRKETAGQRNARRDEQLLQLLLRMHILSRLAPQSGVLLSSATPKWATWPYNHVSMHGSRWVFSWFGMRADAGLTKRQKLGVVELFDQLGISLIGESVSAADVYRAVLHPCFGASVHGLDGLAPLYVHPLRMLDSWVPREG